MPGDYLVNVALGRANLTRKITVTGERATQERFVLNAGGLRVIAVLGNGDAGQRKDRQLRHVLRRARSVRPAPKMMSGLRPGVVVRLNAGIYSIVSTYGDANAVARSDVTVEAGKLTEVTAHPCGGQGDASSWSRAAAAMPSPTRSGASPRAAGEAVKESVGALPTHILAPGTYTVSARHAGQVYQREFTVQAGDFAQVEVVMR